MSSGKYGQPETVERVVESVISDPNVASTKFDLSLYSKTANLSFERHRISQLIALCIKSLSLPAASPKNC